MKDECVVVGVVELNTLMTNPTLASHCLDMGVHQVLIDNIKNIKKMQQGSVP